MSVPTGNIMKTAALYRIVNGVPVLTRTQPAVGFDSRLVFDYECPYDASVTYRFDVTYTDPSALTTVWDETWANLSNWTGATANYSVSAGVASAGDSSTTAYTISRTISTPGLYQIAVGKMSGPYQVTPKSGLFLMSGSFVVAQIAPTGAGNLMVVHGTTTYSTGISDSVPFTIDMLGDTIVLTGSSSGSYSWASTQSISSIQLTAASPGVTSFGEIKVSAYGAATLASSTSTTVGLSPLNSWMIHPSNPGLSIPISSADRTTATIRNLGDITNPSASTEHTILGQSEPITTTSGPRYSNRLQTIVGVRSRIQEQALNAILADGTPLLFRFPAIFDAGFDEGFYSVGDVTRARFAQRPGDPLRNFTLPLTQVQSPIVNVQNTGWSFAALAATFTAFSILTSAYNTYADADTDNRNVGF